MVLCNRRNFLIGGATGSLSLITPYASSIAALALNSNEQDTLIPYDETSFAKIGDGFDLSSYSARHNSALVSGKEEPQTSGPTLDFSLNVSIGNTTVINNNSVAVSAEAHYFWLRKET